MVAKSKNTEIPVGNILLSTIRSLEGELRDCRMRRKGDSQELEKLNSLVERLKAELKERPKTKMYGSMQLGTMLGTCLGAGACALLAMVSLLILQIMIAITICYVVAVLCTSIIYTFGEGNYGSQKTFLDEYIRFLPMIARNIGIATIVLSISGALLYTAFKLVF
jgi:Flp pilus assembly protein TadB